MKNLFSRIWLRLIPPLVTSVVAGILRGLKDRAWQHSETGKAALVLMNGPSLTEDIQAIDRAHYHTIYVVNHFADHALYEALKPTAYIMQDAYFWQPHVADFYRHKREKTFARLEENTHWPLTLYVPNTCDHRDVFTGLANPHIRVHYYNARFAKGNRSKLSSAIAINPLLFLSWRYNFLAPPPENVLVAGLYLPYLQGHGEIDFLGADMSQFKALEVNQQTNQLGFNVEHFYGKEFFLICKDKQGETPSSMSHELTKWAKVFHTFEVLQAFFAREKITVTNRGTRSFVDAFPRETDRSASPERQQRTGG